MRIANNCAIHDGLMIYLPSVGEPLASMCDNAQPDECRRANFPNAGIYPGMSAWFLKISLFEMQEAKYIYKTLVG